VLTEEFYVVYKSKESTAILLEESDVTDLRGEACMIEERVQ